MLMLSVNVDQLLRELPEEPRGHGLVVHAQDAPVLHDLSRDDQRSVFLRHDAEFPDTRKPLFPGHGKKQLDVGIFSSGPDQALPGLGAQCRRDGIDQDRFSGAGLTGQDGQSLAELKIRLSDQGEISYMQF